MDWPSSLATPDDLSGIEDDGYYVIPYAVRADREQHLTFAAMVYQEAESSVSGWFYHPQAEEWREKESVTAQKTKKWVNGQFERDLFVFGSPGREADRIQTEMATELARYIGSELIMHDSASAAALQNHISDTECSCTINTTAKFGQISINVEGGDSVPVIACGECGKPYYIGDLSGQIAVDDAVKQEWVFSSSKPDLVDNTDGLEFYYVNPPTQKRIHYVIAALANEVSAEILLSQDYNVDADQFLLVSNGAEILGFISWNQRWESPSLTQIYIRPQHRGNGFAKQAIRSWCDYIEGDFAYGDQLNAASRSLLGDMGLFETGESDFTIQEFVDFYVQIIKMDADIYQGFGKGAFPN